MHVQFPSKVHILTLCAIIHECGCKFAEEIQNYVSLLKYMSLLEILKDLIKFTKHKIEAHMQ